MKQILISLGSNTNQTDNICKAIELIAHIATGITCSEKVWTAPIGMVSDRFLNCIVSGYTTMSLDELTNATKSIEKLCGRTKGDKDKGIIKIDIDILRYNNETLHPADWERDYIKHLVAGLSIAACH